MDNAPRILLLVLIAVGVAVAVEVGDQLVTGGQLTRRFFWPEAKAAPEWKDLFQALLILMGLPVGLMLWYWRDLSVRHQIENARKDTTLKEFAELQMRAAGAMDEKAAPEGARIALQIAALHQLRPYLRGEAGRSFKLAAFEIYCSILEGRVAGSAPEEGAKKAEALRTGRRLGPLIDARVFGALRDIIAQEWKSFFYSGFPLDHRSFRELRLPPGAVVKRLTIKGSDFGNSNFTDVYIEDCNFDDCSFKGVNFDHVALYEVTFSACDLGGMRLRETALYRTRCLDSLAAEADWSRLQLVDCEIHRCIAPKLRMRKVVFSRSVLSTVQLAEMKFSDVKFDSSYLVGNDTTDASLTGTFLASGTIVIDDTLGSSDIRNRATMLWNGASETRRQEMLATWTERGARMGLT